MSTHAQAQFEVQSWDENTYVELDGGAKLTRASVGQAFTGDLEGDGSVEWLMCYREDKTADFVGLQRFVGRLGSRSGSFVMHTQGSFDGDRGQGQPRRRRPLGHRGAGRHHGQAARSPPRTGPRPRSSSTTTSSSPMAALARDGNVLGALSLVVADQMSDAVAAAADQSLTAAAALSALEHFADGCSIDRLRRILGLTSSGTVRLVDRLVAAGEVRRREGPDGRTTSVGFTAAGRRAARRVTAARAAVLEDALADLSPAERADLERLAARVLEGVVRRKLAREAESTRWICRLCDMDACGRAEGRCPAANAARRRLRGASPQASRRLRRTLTRREWRRRRASGPAARRFCAVRARSQHHAPAPRRVRTVPHAQEEPPPPSSRDELRTRDLRGTRARAERKPPPAARSLPR